MPTFFDIAGLIGTAEQVVRLIIHLMDQHDAYKNNRELATAMFKAYNVLSGDVHTLQNDPYLESIQEPHRGILKGVLVRVSDFISNTLADLNLELKTPKGKLRSFANAISDRDVLTARKHFAQELRKDVTQASAHLNIVGEIRSTAPSKEVFKRLVMAPSNPSSVYIDLNLQHGPGAQETCERQLKATVLRNDGNDPIGVFAVGDGGVGKTCALRAIAHDAEVKARFPDGVYFFTLGKDATVARMIQQLCLAVNATNGHDTYEKMRNQTELDAVLSVMLSWFGDKLCLFIFDDLCARNDINKSILHNLSKLVANAAGTSGERSRILYSTRNGDLALVGQRVKFSARERQGAEAERMLLKASGMSHDAVDDVSSKEAIRVILGMCAGLPLVLNVAGTSVRYMTEHQSGDVSKIWVSYVEKVKERGGLSEEQPGDGYLSLNAMLESSLALLESDAEGGTERQRGLSFREMHRALCVMKKLDWIPVSVLCDLWETEDTDAASAYVLEMNRVGLVDTEYRGCTAGLRLHDLTHDFAVREAEENEGCMSWCMKLVNNYCSGRGVVAAAVESRGSDMRGMREEYVVENIYRLLMRAERFEDAKDLVLSPRWVTKVLQWKAVLQYERAVKDLIRYWKGRSGSKGEGKDEVDKDTLCGIEMVMKAARLSVPFCDENIGGICFQLYARTMYKKSLLESVRKFLSDMEDWAPGPWVCPMNECLHRAGGNMLEVFTVPDQYRERMGRWKWRVSVGLEAHKAVIACTWRDFQSEVAVLKFSEEKPVEVVFLNAGYESGQMSMQDSHVSETMEPGTLGQTEFMSQSSAPSMETEEAEQVPNSGHSDGGQVSMQEGDTSETIGMDTLEQTGSMGESPRQSTEAEETRQGRRLSRARRWVARVENCFGKVLETCMHSRNTSETANDDTTSSQVYSTNSGQTLSAGARGDPVRLVGVCVCGSGERVAVGYINGTVMVWSVSEKKVMNKFQKSGCWVASVALSSDGKLLACGGTNGSVQVWRVDDGSQVWATVGGGFNLVKSIAFSSNGRYLVSGSVYGNIRVWDVRSGSQLGETITGHTRNVSSVAIRGDGGQVLSGSFDETVRLWDVKTGSQVGKSMTGHRAGVTSVAMSKDGKRAVSGSPDKTIRLWDLETQSQIGNAMTGHTGSVYSVAMNTDGTRALSGSDDKTLRMWDVEMGWKEEAAKTSHSAAVTCISVSENGKRVVSGSEDRTVRTWDAQSGNEIGNPMPVPRAAVQSVAMSANGRRAISGCDDGWIRCWDVGTGSQLGEAKAGDGSRVNSVAIDGDGRFALSGSENCSVRVWDVERGLQLRSLLSDHTSGVWSVAISSDGTRAISGSGDGEVLLWDIKSGSRVGDSKSGHSGGVESVAMSANGRRAISGARDGTIMFWDVGTGLQVGETLEGDGTPIESVAASANGGMTVSGCSDGRVVIWNAQSGSQVGKAMTRHTESLSSVAISDDGTRAVSRSEDNAAVVWDTKTQTQVGQRLTGHTDWVRSIAMSGNGSLVVSGSDDKTVRVWAVNTGLQVGEAMAGHTSDVSCVATSSDGKHAVSGSYDGSTRIWDLKKGLEVTRTGHTGPVRCVGVNADGSRAVSGSFENSVLAWDVETGLRVGKAMTGHTRPVSSVAVSADGRRTVSGSKDGSVRAWDTESGAQICSAMHGHEGWVWSVAISADGEWAVSGGEDKTVRLWDLQAGAQSGKALTGHTEGVRNVAIGADGKRVVSGSRDDTVRVWDVAKGTCDKIMTDIDWQTACFRSLVIENDASDSSMRTREVWDIYCEDGNKIMYRSDDGVEVVLARFDVAVDKAVFQVDHRRGIVGVGLRNGVVAILRLVRR